MALIQCPDCGEMVSSRATMCIHCGRPFDDLPKKVIRKCGTGEYVLEKEHITQKQAEDYIQSITTTKTYPYSYIAKSGSEFMIVPDDEEIQCVTELKNVVRSGGCKVFGDYVCEEERLTPREAELYCNELTLKRQQKNEHARATGAAHLISDSKYHIVDADAPLNYVDNSQNTITSQPSAPRCPTCGSTSIERISTAAKAAGAFTFGLFSKTAKSQFRCKRCGYKW